MEPAVIGIILLAIILLAYFGYKYMKTHKLTYGGKEYYHRCPCGCVGGCACPANCQCRMRGICPHY